MAGYWTSDPRNLLPVGDALGWGWVDTATGEQIANDEATTPLTIDAGTYLTNVDLTEGVSVVPDATYTFRVNFLAGTVAPTGSVVVSAIVYDRATATTLDTHDVTTTPPGVFGTTFTVPTTAIDPLVSLQIVVPDGDIKFKDVSLQQGDTASPDSLVPIWIETDEYRNPFDVRVVLYYPGGSRYKTLIAADQIESLFALNDHGSMKFNYNKLNSDAFLFDTDFTECALEYTADGVTWKEPLMGRFICMRNSWNETEPASDLSVEMVSFSWIMRKIPMTGNYTVTESGARAFNNVTAGFILKTVIDEARSVGVGSGLTYDFSATEDSKGNPWGERISIEFPAGTDLNNIVETLVQQGILSWSFSGRMLRGYRAANSLNMDHSSWVRYRFGYEIKSAPSESTIEGLASRVTIYGDENAKHTLDRPDYQTPWGKFENVISQGGVSDNATMIQLAEAQLDRDQVPVKQLTRELVWARARRLPWRDWKIGYYISTSAFSNGEQVFRVDRVKSLTITKTAQEGVSGNIVLSDRYTESQIRLAQKLSRLTAGKVTGGSGSAPVTGKQTPKAVTNLIGGTDAYYDNKRLRASVTLDWADVTEDTKGGSLDLGGYEVWMKEHSKTTWQRNTTTGVSDCTVGNLVPGRQYDFRVRAFASEGARRGGYSNILVITTARDLQPPPIPSKPVLLARGGTVSVRWDGLGTASGSPVAMPSDFNRIECSYSLFGSTDFNAGTQPGQLTYLGDMTGPGYLAVTDLAYNTTPTFAFRAYDDAGNVSAWSQTTAVTVNPLVDTDLIWAELDGANIKDGTVVASEKVLAESITAELIGALQIQTDHLAANSVEADKIAVGALDAFLITGAVIRTNVDPNINGGIQFDSGSLSAWSPAGVNTFKINASTGLVSASGSFVSSFGDTTATLRGYQSTENIDGTSRTVRVAGVDFSSEGGNAIGRVYAQTDVSTGVGRLPATVAFTASGQTPVAWNSFVRMDNGGLTINFTRSDGGQINWYNGSWTRWSSVHSNVVSQSFRDATEDFVIRYVGTNNVGQLKLMADYAGLLVNNDQNSVGVFRDAVLIRGDRIALGTVGALDLNAGGVATINGGSGGSIAVGGGIRLTTVNTGTLDIYSGLRRCFAANNNANYMFGQLYFREDGGNSNRASIEAGSSGTLLLSTTGGSYVRFSYATSATTSAGPNAYFNTSGDLGRTSASSRRIKRDIIDLTWGEEQFMELRPVHYRSILPMDEGKKFVGFIAEEVADAGYNELVNYGEDGQTESLNYDRFVVPIVKQMQRMVLVMREQAEQIKALQDQLAAQ